MEFQLNLFHVKYVFIKGHAFEDIICDSIAILI